jgi:ATP-dependent helicase/nuclease subunit A
MPTAPTLTDEQAAALHTRDTSIALAAGAGCGKTFVLSERFLSHLDRDPELLHEAAELRQLIAITFTDAAAREMRRRIRQKCYDRSVSAKTRAAQDDWHKLLRAIEAARVSTIHAFCASLLREHAAGLDPMFGVLEQGAADVLESEVLDDVLRTRLSERDINTMTLAAAFGLSRLKEQLAELVKHRHDDAFHDWQSKSADELVSKWRDCHEQVALPAALEDLAALPEVPRILDLLRAVTPPANKDKFISARATLLELLPRLATGDLADTDLPEIRSAAMIQGVCSAKDWPTSEMFAAYRGACKSFRDALDKKSPKPFDPATAQAAAELGLQLLTLAADVATEYELAKARAGKLDFDDLLARAHRLLTDPENATLRKDLSSDLRLLLVDEFQDTDRIQVELVEALCGEVEDGKLFFVGDMNQSIYRFRGAQPDVFRNLRGRIPELGRLPLTKNFRSQPAILNFVNALFVDALGEEYQALQPNRQQITPEPAIEFLWTITPDKRNRKIPGSVQDARAQEARRIARRLRELIDNETPIIADPSAPCGIRPVRPGDVAILFRALSDVALYETALREYGLEYYLVGGHAFYAQQEIFDVLNLLRSIASPADEFSLAAVLRSPFFSLLDETLYWLADSAGSLNNGLFGVELPKELSTDERLKATAAAATLASLRERKDSLPITTLLQEALARTGYDAALLGEFLGERKLANLNKLLEQARTADSGNVLDLTGFIAQLAEFVAREPKEALAATLSESADVIRLMTIHQSKGLEFPLVILPDIDRKSDFRGPSAALDPDLGPVVAPPADEESDEPSTTGIDLYRSIEKRADAEERKRLFYVATTRAADYLILSSSLAGYDPDELESDWTKLLAERFDITSTGEFRGALPAGYETPHVRVTNTDPVTKFKPIGASRGADLVAIVQDARDLAGSGGGVIPPDVGPLEPDATARVQFSVSRLSGKLVRPDSRELPWAPILDPEAVDPLTFGTMVHAALQRVPLTGKLAIAPLCEQLATERVLRNSGRAAEDATAMLERFASSPRWKAITAAKTVHRELEFLLAWSPDAAIDRYLQGFFDCIYQDAAGWHLIDYKTNDVTAAKVPRESARYEMQMLVYALALERALGEPPVELVLHFLRPGVEHKFPWNDDMRRRCIELVEAAMHEPSLSDT